MILVTTKVADFERFLKTFSTVGVGKRTEHGSRHSHVFRDPEDASRVWVVFDWDLADYEQFFADPEVPAIFQEAGVQGRPVRAESAGEYGA
ncbi:MAG: hypothetical protein ACRD03_02975 [Acidimicrobiales bacterium]